MSDPLTTAYTEVCRSYQALHEFRMKLLGLLPLASIAGFLVLGKAGTPLPRMGTLEANLIGSIGLFAALFTLALFMYEARGILMCYDLWYTGMALEERMDVEGQFRYCDESRNLPCYSDVRRRYARKINDKIASGAVYSLTFAAWFFVGLHFLFQVELPKCGIWAGATGLILAAISIAILNALTAKPNGSVTAAQPKPATAELSTP